HAAAARQLLHRDEAAARRRMLTGAEGHGGVDAERDRRRARRGRDMRAVDEETADAQRRKALLVLGDPVARRHPLDAELAEERRRLRAEIAGGERPGSGE